ncbi:NfeD family protein [Oleiharenicola lentus]|uniref:NfeD family protein n=1 Tax=Oleiharenicola lentus TaxID=2508720 RepID=UPI003F67C3F9
MTLVLFLFIVGAVLLALEVVVPGAILGIMGGVCLLVGVIAAFMNFGADGGVIAGVVALVIVAVVLYIEFVYLPKSRLVKTFSMTGTVAGQSQPKLADASIIGKPAVAVTPLSPSGVIELEGRRYEAYSRDGHVNAGAPLAVVGLDNFRLIVSQPAPTQKL